jgi:TPR repeat protein
MDWYRKATEQGDADAPNELGFMYINGQGVTQDYVEAHKWHNLASAAGYADIGRAITWVAGMINPAEIAQAQLLARQCVVNNYVGC